MLLALDEDGIVTKWKNITSLVAENKVNQSYLWCLNEWLCKLGEGQIQSYALYHWVLQKLRYVLSLRTSVGVSYTLKDKVTFLTTL